MSRAKGYNLPRIPDTNPRIMATTSSLTSVGASSLEIAAKEQNAFKSFLGSRRQDVTSAVLGDSVMYDDVFCKQGRLEEQNAPKSNLPLTCRPYNSLHDKHVRPLYSRNPGMRKHLIERKLITPEMRICSTQKDVYEKIRSHEMLERKELLQQQMEEREKQRLRRLQQAPSRKPQQLPPVLDWSMKQERKRQAMRQACIAQKADAQRRKAEAEAGKERVQKQLQHQKWLKHLEEEELEKEKKRRAEIIRQQELRSAYYDRKFADLPRGQQLAEWHKQADIIHSRLTYMQHQVWLPQQQQWQDDEDVGLPSATGTLELDSMRQHLPQAEPIGSLERSSEALIKSEFTSQTSLDGKKIKPAEVSTSSRPEARSAEAKLDEKQTLTTSKSSVTSKKSNKSKDSGSTKTTPTRTTPATTPPKKEQEKDMDESDGGKENEEAALDLGEPPELQDDLEVHILNVMQSMDIDGSGYISVEDILKALQFHCEALEFQDVHVEALQQLANDLVDLHTQAAHGPAGCVSYQHAVAAVADLLRQASTDAITELYPSGSIYMWAQLPDYIAQQTLWFNRETGEVSFDRPVEDQPAIRDEFFEETMVNMFIENDLNSDDLLDRNEFLQLLQSNGVGSRLTPEQIEELWLLFDQSSMHSLNFDQFVPFARLLILMIYSNQYETDDEWVELSCPKCRFWYSKYTGHCILLPPDIVWVDPSEGGDGGAAAGVPHPPLGRSDSAFGRLVSNQSTIRDNNRVLPAPVPAPPAPSRQHNYGMQTTGLSAITEETNSVPSRPNSSAA